MKYKPTVTIATPQDFDGLTPGQWFRYAGKTPNAGRGQWLGKTKAGVDILRMQAGKFGSLADCKRNRLQRNLALMKGAK